MDVCIGQSEGSDGICGDIDMFGLSGPRFGDHNTFSIWVVGVWIPFAVSKNMGSIPSIPVPAPA